MENEEDVGDIAVEYLSDEKIQNDNIFVERPANLATEMELFRSNDEWEKVDKACYDPASLSWITQVSKRAILKDQPLNYSFPEEELAHYQALYLQEASMYRPYNVKLPIHGLFEFCGCDILTCARNVCCVGHGCGFCLKRIDAFCFREPGT